MDKKPVNYGEGPTFLEPQEFNVDLSAPETDRLYPQPRRRNTRPLIPVVPQEITPDRDLYPPVRYGVRRGVVR